MAAMYSGYKALVNKGEGSSLKKDFKQLDQMRTSSEVDEARSCVHPMSVLACSMQ